MDVQRKFCSHKTIEQFLTDRLSEADLESFEQHLQDCSACRAKLENMAAEESWWDEARGYLSSGGSAAGQSWAGATAVRGSEDAAEEAAFDLYGLKSYLAPTDDPRMWGRIGGYEIVGVVGCGGMGIVLKAFEPPLNRYVAIKVLGPQLALSQAARQRFTREAKAAAAVVHDNVIAIHTISEAGGLPYFVMPYLRGPSLERRLQQAGALAVDEVLSIGVQIARGLAAAHAQGLVHRDIKPANILLEEGVERVTITDFGLARAVDDVTLTRVGVIAGTPQFMSPEQAKGDFVDHRSDLFSLGSVLYMLCTGKAPFRADSTLGVLRRVEEGRPRPIQEINPGIPAWLAGVVERLHAKDPAERLQSAAVVAALLEGYLAHLRQPATISAPELPPLPLRVEENDQGKRTEKQANAETKRRADRKRHRVRSSWALVLCLAPCLLASQIAVWLVGTGTFAGGGVPGQAQAPAQLLYQDFRGAREPQEPLGLFGDDASTAVKPEPQGLRITVSKERQKTEPVGIVMTSPVEGDFEITAGYEILQTDRPKTAEPGAGFEFFISTATPTRHAIAFYRTARAQDGDIYACGHNYNPTPADKRRYDTRYFPTSARSGQLRLTRNGGTITYWVAEGAANTFRELRTCDFGAEDLNMVRLAAFPGRTKSAADIRIVDLKIRTAAPIAAVPATTAAAAPEKPRGWLAAALILFVGLGLSFIGLWVFMRHNRRAALAPWSVSEVDIVAEPSAPSPFITFPCSGCGKTLKVKTEWAGKKGKCSSCGAESLVPELTFAASNLPALETGITAFPAPRSGSAARWLPPPLWVAAPIVLMLFGLASAFWYARAAVPAQARNDSYQEYSQSFRGTPPDSRGFEPFGPDAEQCVKYEPAGLRITLPAGYDGERDAVGLATHIVAQGDFEITTTFEILQEPSTADSGKNGTRLSIMVGLESPKQDVVRITRGVRADSGTQFIAWSSVWDNDAGKKKNRYGTAPASAKTGRLRLVRAGSTLSYYVSEGVDRDFVLLQEYPFTQADVRNVSLVGSTSGPKAGLDVRFTDFHIRANSLPGLPGAAAATFGGFDWPAAGGIVFLALVISLALGAWFYVYEARPASGSVVDDSVSDADRAKPTALKQRVLRWSPLALWLSAFVLLTVLGSQLILGLVNSREEQQAGPALAETLHEDLRSTELNSTLLRTVGDGVVPEAGGVRVTLPAGEKHPPSGLLTAGLTVHGDFEITTSFEILKADRPATGYGVGVSVYAQIDSATKDAFSLARRILPDGKELLMADRMRLAGGKEQHEVKSFPSTATAGKLRLKRVGSVLHYLFAEGDSRQFTDLHQVEIGKDDIQLIQIGGHTGGSQSGLDLRLFDFTVQADQLPGVPQAGGQLAWGKSLLLGAEFLGLLLVLSTAVSLAPRRVCKEEGKHSLLPLVVPVKAKRDASRGANGIGHTILEHRWLLGSLGLILPVLVCAWVFWPQRPAPGSLIDVELGNRPVVQVQDIKFLPSLPPPRPQVPIVGDGSKKTPLSTPMIFTPLLTCAALAPDGKLVVAGAPEGTIVTLDIAGNRHSVLPRLAPQLLAIAVNPTSGMFATATDDRLVKIWETATGKPRAALSGHTGQITALAFSPDGKTLASVGGDRFRPGELKLWDPNTGKQQVAIEPFKLRLWCVAIAPDGKRAAVGSGDGTAYLVDMKSGKVQTSFAVTAYIRRIAFSPDGKWLAAGYGDKGQVRILGVNDGKLRSDLQVPGGTYVEGLEFTRDSKRLFTACGEGNAVIWDLSKAPAPVATLTAAKTGALPFALLLPDGRSFATGGKDGLIQLVRFPDERNFATRALIEFLRVVHP